MGEPTFTYGGNPQSSPLDEVRLILGDTDAAQPLLYDGEVAYFLGKANQDIPTASYQACGAIIAKLSRWCDESVDEMSLALSQRVKAYSDLQAVLQRDLGQGAQFFAGGISRTQMRQNAANPDRVAAQVPGNQTRPVFPRRLNFVSSAWCDEI